MERKLIGITKFVGSFFCLNPEKTFIYGPPNYPHFWVLSGGVISWGGGVNCGGVFFPDLHPTDLPPSPTEKWLPHQKLVLEGGPHVRRCGTTSPFPGPGSEKMLILGRPRVETLLIWGQVRGRQIGVTNRGGGA